MNQIHKYPRTHHISGSRFQPGDEELKEHSISELLGKYVVIEEKMDGANCAVSFSATGKLLLQSRGHYLTGGPREKHFDLFKAWTHQYRSALWNLLGDRYIMYGEWLYAKHTIYYDQLPHYFMEFDVLDTKEKIFLSTAKRKELLSNAKFISPVKVLFEGYYTPELSLGKLITPSFFISNSHLAKLQEHTEKLGYNPDIVLKETDPSTLMEGLYIKMESEKEVTERYKYVRQSFLTAVFNAEGHWLNRPVVPNQLIPGVDIFQQ